MTRLLPAARSLPLLLPGTLAAAGLVAQAGPGAARSGELGAKLDAGLSGGGEHEVFVRMRDQLFVDARGYPAFCAKNGGRKRGELRAETVADLKRRAREAWRAVETSVAALQEQGALRAVRRYWVVNGFGCVARTAACRTLAGHAAVAFVYRKPVPRLPRVALRKRPARGLRPAETARMERAIEMWDRGARTPFDPAKVRPSWNLARIGADRAWREEGATGKGVTIALLDTGIHVTPPLVHALWRNQRESLAGEDEDGNGYADDVFGWSFVAGSPCCVGDPGQHGSMCGGIMAGRPVDTGEEMLATGIAPEARLMVLRGMGFLAAYEYALDNGADIVSMSYMWVNAPLGNWRGLYRLAHEHMTAAGIVAVGGAGNFARSAPPGRQIALPKDVPCVVAAAGLNRAGERPAASSEGPCYWDDVVFYRDHDLDHPLQKPDVTGFFTGFPVWVDLRRRRWRAARRNVVYRGDDGYGLLVGPGGNSFSGPHAGGVAALMMSANRDLPAWRVIELMKRTCQDLGPEGHDVTYGAGLLQAAAAVRAAKEAGDGG